MEITFQDIGNAERNRSKAAFCVVVATQGATPRKESAKMIVYDNGKTEGTVGGGNVEFEAIETARQVIETRKPQLCSFNLKDNLGMECGGSVQIYIEPLARAFPLYIFGGGHVGQAIAGYAKDFGFDITVVDTRAEVLQQWDTTRFRCLQGPYAQILPTLEYSAQSFFVVTTPRHQYDSEVLGYIGSRPAAYLGVMASKAKVGELRRQLMANQVLTAEQLDCVDMPIGVPMACETPAEIAISVLARIIDVKNKLLGYETKK